MRDIILYLIFSAFRWSNFPHWLQIIIVVLEKSICAYAMTGAVWGCRWNRTLFKWLCMANLYYSKSNCMYAAHKMSSRPPGSSPKRTDLLIQAAWWPAKNFGVKSCLSENPVGILLLTSTAAGSRNIFLSNFSATFGSFRQ